MNLQLIELNFDHIEKILFYLLIKKDLNHDDSHIYFFAKKFKGKIYFLFNLKLFKLTNTSIL
jgi:hypothetical protein